MKTEQLILGRKIQDTFREYEDSVDLSARKDSDLNVENLKISRNPFTSPQKFENKLSTRVPNIATTAIDVVIPLFGESQTLLDCLDAVQKSYGLEVRVILVDNGAPSRVLQEAEKYECVRDIIRNEANEGFGGGCDQGIKASQSQYVVLLNSDAIVEPSTISSLISTMEMRGQAGVVGSLCRDADGSLAEVGRYIQLDAHSIPYGENENILDSRFLTTKRVPYVSFVCVALDRAAYEKVGGFSEEFFPAYYEDTDLCFRFTEAGLHVLVNPQARVTHKGSESAEVLEGVNDIREGNRKKFLVTHYDELHNVSFDIDAYMYPHEREMIMAVPYEKRVLMVAKTAHAFEDMKAVNTYDNFYSLLCFGAEDNEVNELRELGCEVSVGFGKKLHHWVRERVCLFDEVIFLDNFSGDALKEILTFSQPGATFSYPE